MEKIKPHIHIFTEGGRVVLKIYTWELTDFLDDYLTEKHGISYDWHKEIITDNNELSYYLLYFSEVYTLKELSKIIQQLKDNEIEEIVKFQLAQKSYNSHMKKDD